MCGIAGFHGIEADDGLAERLGRCPLHPTAEVEAFEGEGSGLTGTSAGRAGERFEIVFDGEIYNRVMLRSQLVQLGHTFTTEADREVVLAAFIEWGAAGFDRLNGPFAVAVRDVQASTTTLARDHFGIRSLYLAPSGRGWLFATSIAPILSSGHHERSPNERTIYRYLRFGVHDDGPETFFEGIERVGAGEVVTITDAGVDRRPFTALRSELGEAASQPREYDASVVREFRSRLTEAVRLRLRTPGPVAVALSGGIDSSAVTAVVDSLATTGGTAVKAVGAQLNTFSALFPASANDEQEHIDAVTSSRDIAVDAHTVSPTPTEFKNDLGDFIRTQEEPLVSSGPYTQYRVFRAAAEAGVSALLEGLGGDETLAGYGAHHLVHLRQLRQTGTLGAVTEVARSAGVLARRGKPGLSDRLHGRTGVPVTTLLDQHFLARHRHERVSAPHDDLRERLLDDIFVGSLPARLRYDDRNARRFGVSSRMPLLDKDLVRFGFGLSSDALLKDGLGKRVLRDAVRDDLPASVVARRDKVGLETPQGEWLLRLKNHIYGVFLSEPFANRPYFDQSEVLHTFEAWIKGGSAVDSMTIWRLLNLELWLQEFFDERPEADPEPVRVKTDYEANAHKQLDLTLGDGTVVRRYPLRTGLFSSDDDLQTKTLDQVARFFDGIPTAGDEHAAATSGPWHLFISEKVVAITQGRSYFIWDIKVGRPARVLSRYVTRTPRRNRARLAVHHAAGDPGGRAATRALRRRRRGSGPGVRSARSLLRAGRR